MKNELKEFRVHGLISDSCAGQINTILDERYQDFRSLFANDGVQGQWIRVREWWFRKCCAAVGGKADKFKADAHTDEMIALEKQLHRERLGSIKALDVSKINRKLAVTPDDVQLETIPDDAESGAGTGFSTMASPTLDLMSADSDEARRAAILARKERLHATTDESSSGTPARP